MATKLATKTTRNKPAKPSKDFPLQPAANGQWCKKIKGKRYHFGPWSDPDAALARYLDQRDDLVAGRKPRQRSQTGPTVADLANLFLTDKRGLVDSGELVVRSFADYKTTADRIVAHFGRDRAIADIGPEDFAALRRKLAKTRGPVALGNEVNRVRVVFNYTPELDGHPAKPYYGKGFKRPSASTVRKNRNERAEKFIEPADVRKLIEAACPQVRAMIFLGINCGLGNADVGRLRIDAIDLDAGVIDDPRKKTGVDRRATLWPETVEALRQWLAIRKTPADADVADLVFVTRCGVAWLADSHGALSAEFGKLAKRVEIHRKGVGFYSLRHSFNTIGEDATDAGALSYIMGHAPSETNMRDNYRRRRRISDDRLRAVTDTVRRWLFGSDDQAGDDQASDDASEPNVLSFAAAG